MAKLSTHLLELWHRQNGKCFYTGRDMTLNGGYHKDDSAATVDRIEPNEGYIKDNIVLCTAIVNRVKQNLSISELFTLLDEIRNHLP